LAGDNGQASTYQDSLGIFNSQPSLLRGRQELHPLETISHSRWHTYYTCCCQGTGNDTLNYVSRESSIGLVQSQPCVAKYASQEVSVGRSTNAGSSRRLMCDSGGEGRGRGRNTSIQLSYLSTYMSCTCMSLIHPPLNNNQHPHQPHHRIPSATSHTPFTLLSTPPHLPHIPSTMAGFPKLIPAFTVQVSIPSSHLHPPSNPTSPRLQK
jgi:hypothetical protein